MHRLLLTAAAALLLACPANGQQKPAEAPPAVALTKPVVIPKGVFRRGQTDGQYSAKERLIGTKVTNKTGEAVGEIEDLILTNSGNAIDTVVIGVGGVLGVGEKKIGVAYSALQFSTKDGQRVVTLDTSKEVLTEVKPYKYAEPPKTAVQRAAEAAKEAAKKASEATKNAVEKAKEAVKNKTAN